ncbi:MAG: aminotransferase class III-fold pyridoxal phosphate-dependent enzyme [Pseudomonadota bacterium]
MQSENFLKEHNAQHVWHPMAHPADSMANPPKIICRGEGVYITDVDGARRIDAVGGLWNVNLGYSCQPVKDAIAAQLDALPYYAIFRGTSTDATIELSVKLRDFFAPEGLTRAFFTSGGSDSVEICLRLARQYHKLKGQADRVKFLALKKGYHGTHTGCAAVNGNSNFRRNYEPMMPGVSHIPAPYTYRNPFNETDPAKLAQLCLNAMEDEIQFQGPDTIAAFIMEPVLGAGGVIPPHESFLPGARALCDKYGILLIADEVITAYGRTGSWCGSRHFGVQPDLMATAKAITNGYFPFGAAMISAKVADAFESDRSALGAVFSGYTYSGHPTGAAAAIACLDETLRLDVASNAAARGDQMHAGLQAIAARHEIVGDCRGGHGLMNCLELVSNPDAKTPLDKARVAAIHEAVYQAGTMVRVSGNNMIMSPPLVISESEVDDVLNAIDAGLAAGSSH